MPLFYLSKSTEELPAKHIARFKSKRKSYIIIYITG